MASFTLDELRSAIEEKFEGTDVTLASGEKVVLRNVMRMSKEERDQLEKTAAALDETDDDTDVDEDAVMYDLLVLFVGNKDAADRLFKEAGGDTAALMFLVQTHMERTELGEASASQD